MFRQFFLVPSDEFLFALDEGFLVGDLFPQPGVFGPEPLQFLQQRRLLCKGLLPERFADILQGLDFLRIHRIEAEDQGFQALSQSWSDALKNAFSSMRDVFQ